MQDTQILPEDSQTEALAHYESKGFTGQFGTLAGGRIVCHACQGTSPAGKVPLQGLHRLEGASDPDEEAVVAALKCPRCQVKGTLLLPYGPGAPAEDAVVLASFMDARGGQIRQGL